MTLPSLPGLGPHETGLMWLIERSSARPTEEETRNLDVVRRLKSGPVEERHSYQAPDFVVHRHGIESLKSVGGLSGRAFVASSMTDRHDHLLVMSAKDDLVWAVWVVTGTHTGPILGVEATGKPVWLLEFGVWRLVDGLVAEAWFLADEVKLGITLGLLQPGAPKDL